ncbi:hypothetical protein AB4K20DRAFT_1913650 [Rhizopus microsporus]
MHKYINSNFSFSLLAIPFGVVTHSSAYFCNQPHLRHGENELSEHPIFFFYPVSFSILIGIGTHLSLLTSITWLIEK